MNRDHLGAQTVPQISGENRHSIAKHAPFFGNLIRYNS